MRKRSSISGCFALASQYCCIMGVVMRPPLEGKRGAVLFYDVSAAMSARLLGPSCTYGLRHGRRHNRRIEIRVGKWDCLRRRTGQKRLDEEAEESPGDGPPETKLFWFVVGAMVGAKENVHERRDVG